MYFIVCPNIGESELKATRFMLAPEGEVIIEHGITSFMEAFAFLMAAFYVFEMCCPTDMAATMAFIQR